jgi:hypothetical protein
MTDSPRKLVKPLTRDQRERLDEAARQLLQASALISGVVGEDVDRLLKEVLRLHVKQIMGSVIFLENAALLKEVL